MNHYLGSQDVAYQTTGRGEEERMGRWEEKRKEEEEGLYLQKHASVSDLFHQLQIDCHLDEEEFAKVLHDREGGGTKLMEAEDVGVGERLQRPSETFVGQRISQ